MCIYKRYLVNSLGRRVLVKCGHCPACLQEKAIARTNKIRAELPALNTSLSSEPMVSLFFTLTYSNDYVPFISKSALSNISHFSIDDKFNRHCLVSVYRNATVAYTRTDNGYVPKVTKGLVCLDSFDVVIDDSIDNLCSIRNGNLDSVGVCYFTDIQNFIKRLRINLNRHYNYDKYFRFFVCSEYGPTTCRPHFHGLLFIPADDYLLFQCAISESWPFDDGLKAKEYCQIARNAQSYVSSYVNCSNTIPAFLQNNKCFAPRASYSHGLGSNLRSFSFTQIAQSFFKRDLRYVCSTMQGKSVCHVSLPYPKYIISRFFPRFKGFSRLADNEVFCICKDPFVLPFFAKRLSLSESQITQIQRLIFNKSLQVQSFGFTHLDFALMYSQIWTIYSSNLLKDSLSNIVQPFQFFYAYDNIDDYFSGKVRSLSLDELGEILPPDFKFISDFNALPSNIAKDDRLRFAFDSYSKDKKIRNFIYSKNHNL